MNRIHPVNFVVVASILSLCVLSGCHPQIPTTNTYHAVHIATAEIHVDGLLEEEAWKSTCWESGLSFPWQDRGAPGTKFCAFNSGGHFYFAFRVVDSDLVIASDEKGGEIRVAKGDRVEIFFSKDKALADYYCLEFSANGHVLDYQASYYRRFDTSWDCPGLVVSTRILDDGYSVEGSIPHKTLVSLGLLGPHKPGLVFTGLFRAEFSHGLDGKIQENWISWVKPKSKDPDFHIPSAFGVFSFPASSSSR